MPINLHHQRAGVIIPPAGACRLKEYWFSGFYGSACPLRASGHSVNAIWNITNQVCKTFSAVHAVIGSTCPCLGCFHGAARKVSIQNAIFSFHK
jgi:hypothetical protein